VVSNQSGLYQLYGLDIDSRAMTQLTDNPRGKLFGAISVDGRWVFYLRDEGGNEIGHFVRVPFEGGEAQDITPTLPPYSSFFISTSRDGKRIGMTAATEAGITTYTLDVDGGSLSEPKPLATFKRFSVGPLLSADGEVGVLMTTERSGTLANDLKAYRISTGQEIAELSDGGDNSIEFGTFSPLPGDQRVLAFSNRAGFAHPLIWNPVTGERRDVDLPGVEGEIRPLSWSPDAKRVVVMILNRAQHQLALYDLKSDQLVQLNHPGGTYSGGAFRPNGELMVVHSDAVSPSQVLLLDGETAEQLRVVVKAGDVPAGHRWRSVEFRSSDGAMIQAWVAAPEGAGPFPTIMHMHGGPTAVTTDMFLPSAQAWLDHGFAFCSVNYRGSVTFGQDFEKKIWGDLGHWEVEDVAAAHKYVVEQGIAKPDAILLTGGSYGGYLTLQVAGKYPDLWAGGMGTVAIADWTVMYEDEADILRAYQRAFFGGAPDERPDEHRAASPITYAERIKAPLMVIQGRNDTRCPSRQYEQYEQKLKALGKQIETIWFDAGHGSYSVDEQIEHMEHQLRFAYCVLG
jgi:dipeptidyl aminopeptidase/acylaminoacyl peptidase